MNMDYQVLFNGVFTLAVFLAGWVLNNITKTIQRLDDDVRRMPSHYVTKDDYHRDIDQVLKKLDQIWGKLGEKVDR